jgi:hypothetical protein
MKPEVAQVHIRTSLQEPWFTIGYPQLFVARPSGGEETMCATEID